MRRLNVEKLQGVLRNHGIRIKNDDPVFTLLALNEIALDRMIYSQRQTLPEAQRKAILAQSYRSIQNAKIERQRREFIDQYGDEFGLDVHAN